MLIVLLLGGFIIISLILVVFLTISLIYSLYIDLKAKRLIEVENLAKIDADNGVLQFNYKPYWLNFYQKKLETRYKSVFFKEIYKKIYEVGYYDIIRIKNHDRIINNPDCIEDLN